MPPLVARVLFPALFVWIWSTGFLVGRAVGPHADSSLFLTLRFLAVAAIFTAIALAMRAPWPRRPRQIAMHLAAGALMNGVYLGPSWWAMSHGLPAGVMALIGALQPLFTALIAALVLGASLGRTVWAGLAVGFAGVALVLLPRLAAGAAMPLSPWVVAAGVFGIFSLTVGSMVQKSPDAVADIRSASAIQSLGGAAVTAVLAFTIGDFRWDHAPALWFAFGWSVIVLSLVGTTLLIWLMRRGEATRTAALLLLVPPLAAVESWVLLGETLTPVQIGGFVLAIAGVAMARRAR